MCRLSDITGRLTQIQGYSYDQLIGWVDFDLRSSPGWWPILYLLHTVKPHNWCVRNIEINVNIF